MTQNTNKISICVPVYNRPDLTIKALGSVLHQTVKPFEVIVVNDCSIEDMQEVEEFCRTNNFIYQNNVKNLGLMENVNKTISLAKGDFCCVLHNDDMLSPVYIEKCLDFLGKYPEFNIWTTNGCAINAVDDVIAEFRLFKKDTTLKKGGGFETIYKGGYYTFLSIIGSTIYRTSFIKNHLFDSAWGNEADLDNSLYFLANYDIKYIDTAIYFARMHSKQESKRLKATENKLEKYVHNRISIYKKYQDSFPGVNLLGPVYVTHILQLMVKYKYPINKVCQVLNISILTFLKVVLIYIPIFITKQVIQKLEFSSNSIVLHNKGGKNKGFLDSIRALLFSNPFHGYCGYRLIKFVKRVAKSIPPNQSVLDAGAGECQYKKYLTHAKYVSQDLCIGDAAWDFSKIDIESDIYKIPVKQHSFDHILCIEVLEHLMYPHRAFREFSRILKPGGYLYVVCPLTWMEHQKPYDYFRYTQFALKRLAEESGFIVKEINKHGGKYFVMSIYLNGMIPNFFLERGMLLIGRISQFVLYPFNFVAGIFLFLLDKTDLTKDLTAQYECIFMKQKD